MVKAWMGIEIQHHNTKPPRNRHETVTKRHKLTVYLIELTSSLQDNLTSIARQLDGYPRTIDRFRLI